MGEDGQPGQAVFGEAKLVVTDAGTGKVIELGGLGPCRVEWDGHGHAVFYLNR